MPERETVARPFRYFPCAVLPVPAEESKGWSATIFYLLYSLISILLIAIGVVMLIVAIIFYFLKKK